MSALSDLRVIDLSNGIAGPYCAKMLADFGAEVIKVEHPQCPDPSRSLGPFPDGCQYPQDASAGGMFLYLNGGKKPVTLDMETEQGRTLFTELVESADLVVESFSPGYMDALKLGYGDLEKLNSGVILVSVTPFGQTGPWRDFQTSDLLHMAAGGQMGCCGYDSDHVAGDIPIAPGGGNAWHTGSHYAYMAIVAALVYRTNSGRGQHIDASVHDACALTTEMHVNTYIYQGDVVRRQTGRHASVLQTPQAQLLCKDGKYVNASGSRITYRQFPALVEWMDSHGLADDLADERYQDRAVFAGASDHINDVVANFAKHLTRDEIAYGGQERGFAWGAVRAPDELVDDGHLNDRGFWVDVPHPELGRSFKYPGAAGIYNGSPWRISRRAPLTGEHNEEIYCGELELQRTELAYLVEAGVI